LDGTIGVQGKLAKLKENDKKLKELAAWEKADATVGTVRTASACIHSVVVCRAQHTQTNLTGGTALRYADGATQVRTVAPGAGGVHAEAL
jgi:translation initiation factor 6 (eIF-6)